MNAIVLINNIVASKILNIRDQQVILDSDVADIYGVETRRINEAVKNNPDKFPCNYIIELTAIEKLEVVENFDHLQKIKYSKILKLLKKENSQQKSLVELVN